MASKIPANIEKLIRTYVQAKTKLIDEIQTLGVRGTAAQFQKSLLRQVEEEIEKLNTYVAEWNEENLPKDYKKGVENVTSYFDEIGEEVPSFSAFNKLHTRAIEAIVADTNTMMFTANKFVGRALQDTIRESVNDAIAQKLATGQTVQQAKNNILNTLTQQGLSVVTKNGRKLNLANYAELVARSTTREATNTATLNHITESGHDLVKMSSHSASCPICSPLEGRVYSISGKNPEYPALDKAYSGSHANIHPNCKHVLIPYIPKFVDKEVLKKDKEFSNRPFDIDPRTQKSRETYDRVQKQKRDLNTDRKQWERYRMLMPDDAPKTLSAFRAMKKANSDKYKELQSKYRSLRALKETNVRVPFVPAKDLKEATQNIKDITGITDVNLGRMPIQLANDYAEGLHEFYQDFPTLRGFVGKSDTQPSSSAYASFSVDGNVNVRGRKIILNNWYSFKPTEYNEKLAKEAERGLKYKGATHKTTAIHEAVHALDTQLGMARNGYLTRDFKLKDGYDYTPGRAQIDFDNITRTEAGDIVKEVRDEVYKGDIGKFLEDAKYLGQYSKSNDKEFLAECISYEYSGQTNPFSAKVLQILKRRVKEVLK